MSNPHPNATVAGGSGGLALLVVWLAGHFGLDMNAEEGVVVAGLLSIVALAIGRNGIAGLAGKFWHGGK